MSYYVRKDLTIEFESATAGETGCDDAAGDVEELTESVLAAHEVQYALNGASLVLETELVALTMQASI